MKKDKVMKAVCEAFGITESELVGRCRKRHLVDARTIFTHNMKGGYTSSRLGEILKKDHTTILHYRKRFDDLLKYDDFREMVEKVGENL